MNNINDQTAAIILAAGRGSRMNSTDQNKVTLTLGSKPMIAHTVSNLQQAEIAQLIAVVGFQSDSVKLALGSQVDYALQTDLLGTGSAVKSALPLLRPEIETILTISGDDSAFYPPKLYLDMLYKMQELSCDILLLTIKKYDPSGLGRIVRGEDGKIIKIVEEKVATDQERLIKEINTGFYCFKREFLTTHIDMIQKNPVSQEYYLTDLVEIALSNNKVVETYYVEDSSIWHGVNKPEDLLEAQQKFHE